MLNGPDMRARPPVGGLLVIPYYVQEEMALFCFPSSRNLTLTNSRARAENDIGAELVRAGGKGSGDLQFRFHRLHSVERRVVVLGMLR